MTLDLNNSLQNSVGGVSKKAIKTVTPNGSSHQTSLNNEKNKLSNNRDDSLKYNILVGDQGVDPEVAHLNSLKLIGKFERGRDFVPTTSEKNNFGVSEKITSLNQGLKQILKPTVKSKLDEIKDLLREKGFSDKEIKLLEPLLENRDFQRLIENNPGLAREMLETIKSDPFNTNSGKSNFEKDNYEVLSELKSTGIESVLHAGLGDSLHDSLKSFSTQNDFNSKLYNSFLDQAMSNPEVQKILNDSSLNDRQKLQGVITNASDFVKNGMAQLGAIEVDGKLVSPGEDSTQAKLIVFGDADARNKFYEAGGAHDQAKKQNPNLTIAFMELGDNENNNALAKSLGINTENISSGDFNAAFITKKGYDPSDPAEFKLNANNLQDSLKQFSEGLNDDDTGGLLTKEQTKDLDALRNNDAKSLSINSTDSKDSDKVADLYSKMVLKKIVEGEDTSLDNALSLGSGSLASLATNVERKFNSAEKSGLNINANDTSEVLGKFSGLESDKISKLKSDLGGEFDARTLGVLLQAGKTDSSQLDANDRDVLKLFDKYQGISGRNTEALYESDMKELHDKGILVDYLYDKVPGSSMTYKEAAESIMNIPSDSRGFFDGATGLNAIASVNTIAQILKDPENAFKEGEGFYARLTIADAKDHNGAFGLNTGNRYVRGNEEATMSLLSEGKIGNVTIYGGNGMTDDEFEKRVKRLMFTGTELSGENGQLSAVADNSSVRGLGLKHVSEEGHGNTSGNHGVSGSMDSSDKHRFETYASLVKGDSFSLNCVACSNLGGNNSYGHVVLNEMAKHLGGNVRLYATGAEIPTPPRSDRITHFKGHIAPGLMTNSDRLIVMQGKQDVSDADMVKLSNAYRDEYNITRVHGDEDNDSTLSQKQQSIFMGDSPSSKQENFVTSKKPTEEDSESVLEWLKKTSSKTA